MKIEIEPVEGNGEVLGHIVTDGKWYYFEPKRDGYLWLYGPVFLEKVLNRIKELSNNVESRT